MDSFGIKFNADVAALLQAEVDPKTSEGKRFIQQLFVSALGCYLEETTKYPGLLSDKEIAVAKALLVEE